MRGVGHRHERAVRCDGRRGRARRTRRTRTAKSCGSGAAVLALSSRKQAFANDGGKRAVLREEHEVSRKAIAQGRPECSRCPVCSCALLFCANRTRDRGCSKHPVFPAPSISRGPNEDANLGRDAPRERECVSIVGWVERSETHHLLRRALMGIASLHPSYGTDFKAGKRRCKPRTQCAARSRKLVQPSRGHRPHRGIPSSWNPTSPPVTARPASISGTRIPLW